MPQSTKDKNHKRDDRNKAAGLKRISPSMWIVAEDEQDILADIKRVAEKYKRRAREVLSNKPNQ